MRPALAALAVGVMLGAASCKNARTETVIVITTSGLRIPDDVDAVHVQLTDVQASDPLWDTVYTICTDTITTGCVTMPFTMTLIPGLKAPSDTTRIVVSAQRSQADVIRDAALFTFTPSESLRLDFVLYGNCLGKLDCADTNQVCELDRSCMPIHPVPFGGEPDLAQPSSRDLGVALPSDMKSSSHDLAGADLLMSLMPDLAAPDLASCTDTCGTSCGVTVCGQACTCNSVTTCISMTHQCHTCGTVGDICCPGPTTGTCRDQSACNGNMCECGNVGEPCCANGPQCNNSLTCIGSGASATCELMAMGNDGGF
jgi:hypothetical protein